MSTLPYEPSLPGATGTHLDTACRHNLQCRVSTDDMLMMLDRPGDEEELRRNKYRYCVHKEELAVGIGRPWTAEKAKKKLLNAYPRIISNLGQMSDKNKRSEVFQKMIKFMYHYCVTLEDRRFIINAFRNPGDVIPDNHSPYPLFVPEDIEYIEENLPLMFDQKSVGYANTLGWAHPSSGDTMSTIMIGGLRTVVNGDFEVYTGDTIMWYWPFEKDCFKSNGERKPYLQDFPDHISNDDPAAIEGSVTADRTVAQRDRFHTREFGQRPDAPKMVAMIKPLIKGSQHTPLYDLERIVGIAIGCARPREKVDIKICRQSW